MDRRPIGMFDSGVGGLTVYKEIKKSFPNEKIIYIGDTKRFPYGSKTKESIIDASKKCIDFLIEQNVKQIIIACGTATSRALNTLQEIYTVPIIGIIEPTAKYIKEKNYKNIGVIATRGTIESNSWEINLHKQAKDLNVYNQECPLLAPMAEEGWTNNEIARLTIREYLKNFNDKNLDALIMGCTHYPIFEESIKECLPQVEIINIGKVLAMELENDKSNVTNNKVEDEFYITDTQCNFKNVANSILKRNIKINGIDLD